MRNLQESINDLEFGIAASLKFVLLLLTTQPVKSCDLLWKSGDIAH